MKKFFSFIWSALLFLGFLALTIRIFLVILNANPKAWYTKPFMIFFFAVPLLVCGVLIKSVGRVALILLKPARAVFRLLF